jgi:ATP-dependent Clp protease ATP-binding subunit ClpA
MATLPPISDPLRRTLNLAAIVDGNEEEVDILTPTDLLLALVRQRGTNVRAALDALGVDRYGFERALWAARVPMTGRRSPQMPSVPGLPGVVLSPESAEVMERAWRVARDHGRRWVETGDLLLALSRWRVTDRLIQATGISLAALEATLRERPVEPISPIQAGPAPNTTQPSPTEATENEEARVQEPAAPRPALVSNVVARLRRQPRGHVLMVGPAGAGKRALARQIARAVEEEGVIPGLSRAVLLREAALARDPVATIREALEEAGLNVGLVVVPNIDRFWLATRVDWREAGDILAEAIWDNTIALLATATPEHLQPLNALPIVRERISVVEIPPANPAEARATLDVWQPVLEETYGLSVEPAAFDEAIRIAQRYVGDEALPGSALDLIHESAALASHVGEPLTVATVRAVASDRLKIPLRQLEPDERQRFLGLADALRQRVLGQETAIRVLSESLLRAAAGLRDPRRPVGSFLFLGPTGVGKTELAKALTTYLFGSQEALIRLDMSEYMERHQVARLIGAPPGYVGYESGGQLTEAVRKRPYSVVLFDEIEKAHADVFNLLLQLLDDGRLTDGQGRTVDFSNTVILLTSNLGGRTLQELTGDPDAQREAAMEALQTFFRPEFLNRLDEIVVFNPLGPNEMRLILDLMLQEETKRAAERGIRLQVDQAAREWLLAQNDRPEWGARPLRRIVQRWLTTPLAQFLLQAPNTEEVHVSAGDDGLKFESREAVETVE